MDTKQGNIDKLMVALSLLKTLIHQKFISETRADRLRSYVHTSYKVPSRYLYTGVEQCMAQLLATTVVGRKLIQNCQQNTVKNSSKYHYIMIAVHTYVC